MARKRKGKKERKRMACKFKSAVTICDPVTQLRYKMTTKYRKGTMRVNVSMFLPIMSMPVDMVQTE